MRDRRQRRHGQGRHVLPADGQEAPARAGGRRAEPPAVHLPRRLGRRVPAAPGRGLPRPRPLRPDLLQPGPPVRGRHPADRGRHGLLHGRRRLRPGDERRDDHRQGHGHDLHRRPAAREGGDRARRSRPRSSAAPTSTRASRAWPTTTRSRTSTRSPSAGRSCARTSAAAARASVGASPSGAARARPGRALRARPGDLPRAGRPAGAHRADRGRQPLRRVQGDGTARRSSAASRGSRAIPVAILANKGVLFAESSRKGAHFIELAASGGSRSSSSRTSRASWSARSTRPAASPGTARSS